MALKKKEIVDLVKAPEGLVIPNDDVEVLLEPVDKALYSLKQHYINRMDASNSDAFFDEFYSNFSALRKFRNRLYDYGRSLTSPCDDEDIPF